MRPKKIAYAVILLFLVPVVSMASPDEASGTVTGVVDGKTFDVRIEKADPRIRHEVERIILADLEIPEESIIESVNESMNESMNESISEGPSAKDLAVAILLNKTVWLDIDDRSEGGRNPDGNLVSILYLSGLDGKPVISPSFNRMLVDYRIAELNDSDANEFDPAEWWPPQETASIENVSDEGDAGAKTTGLNININPTKPKVNVSLSGLNININPTKPKVDVNLSGLNVNVKPTKPNVNVNPSKPVIDVNPTQPNATENETSDASSTDEIVTAANNTGALPLANFNEPIILNNSTVPVTLVNPTSSITVINATGEVTVIDPAKPVKVINSTELSTPANFTGPGPAANLT